MSRHSTTLRTALSTALALTLLPASTAAQTDGGDRWAFDVRGGLGFATDDLGDLELDTGVGFEGTIHLHLYEHVWAYAGWDWFHFSSEAPAGEEIDAEDTGYALGLRWDHSTPGAFGPWIRAGIVIDHVELEDEEGDIVEDSGHTVGWEAGAGVSVPLSDLWWLTPGVRVRSFDPDLELEGFGPFGGLTYVAVDVGLSRRF